MYWRKPSWLVVAVTVVGVFCLSSLGVWQLQRAEEKKQILSELESQSDNTLQALRLPVTDAEKLRYQHVQLEGEYISNKQFVLDNQIRNHKAGYNILTPMRINNTDFVVLIDRGWLPIENSRDDLPEIEVDEAMRTITGTIYTPFGEAYSLGTVDNDGLDWPRLIQYLDFPALSQRLGIELQAFTVRLDKNHEDGFLREWQVFAFSPNRHLAYAVQWFALALTLLIIFIVLHTSKSKD